MILLEQLKLLVNLAQIDGQMAEREKNYIINIGKANGFPESSVETLFYASHDVILAKELTDDQRFNYVFSLVQLMKIDERLYKEEIKYCTGIAEKLGYKPELMVELMLRIKSSPMDEVEKNSLKKLVASYQIKH